MQRKISVDDTVTNHLQEILNRKHIRLEDFVKYAVNRGLSRALVYKIAADPHYGGMKESTSHILQVLLNVSHDELVTWCPNMEVCLHDDPRGFTQDCLKKLSEEMLTIGIELSSLFTKSRNECYH
ncbi:hypothetical protein [Levilactobacillus acidifarinae]|uniref:hypothetical protein n=1 Tax=Levilactobacillus acidifarinae TaxID=267364 RepID=UPI0011911DC5|nr:hypothetical protein [Levilactobacillus acidifarinae]GEO70585.1 hypothetical protein LAC03_24950 [Levilactobacillus acidifarinae]